MPGKKNKKKKAVPPPPDLPRGESQPTSTAGALQTANEPPHFTEGTECEVHGLTGKMADGLNGAAVTIVGSFDPSTGRYPAGVLGDGPYSGRILKVREENLGFPGDGSRSQKQVQSWQRAEADRQDRTTIKPRRGADLSRRGARTGVCDCGSPLCGTDGEETHNVEFGPAVRSSLLGQMCACADPVDDTWVRNCPPDELDTMAYSIFSHVDRLGRGTNVDCKCESFRYGRLYALPRPPLFCIL